MNIYKHGPIYITLIKLNFTHSMAKFLQGSIFSGNFSTRIFNYLNYISHFMGAGGAGGISRRLALTVLEILGAILPLELSRFIHPGA